MRLALLLLRRAENAPTVNSRGLHGFFLPVYSETCISVKRSYGTCDWGRTHIAFLQFGDLLDTEDASGEAQQQPLFLSFLVQVFGPQFA